MATVARNRYLISLSVILFFFFSSIGSFAPFLTSHMRNLGLSLSEVSYINAISAIISVTGPIFIGVLAERRQKYALLTGLSVFIAGCSFLAQSAIPRCERLRYQPLVDFSCDSGLRVERCRNWDDCSDAFLFNNLSTIKLNDCQYQCSRTTFPKPTHPLHICFHSETGNICIVYDSVTGNMSIIEFDTNLSYWSFKEDVIIRKNESDSNRDAIPKSSADVFVNIDDEKDTPKARVSVCNYRPQGSIFLNQKIYQSISCRPTIGDCHIHCRASFSNAGAPYLPNSCEESNGNPSFTFWGYLILRCIGDLFLLTAVCLLDAMTISSTSDYEGAYGRIHIWPALGFSALAPFSGALLDYYTDARGRVNFLPPALVSCVLSVVTSILVAVLPMNFERYALQLQPLNVPPKNNKCCSLEMITFLVLVVILGMQWSIIFTYLPWLTIDIGCSGMMTGLAYTFIFGCSLPFLLISKNMVRNIGRGNLLVFALLFYGTRYAGVSFVFSSWWTLPFAAMGAFTLCIMWVATVAYGQSLAPIEHRITMQYAMNLLHFGIGRSLGCLLGGTLISLYGHRVTFRSVAVFSASLGFIYLALYHLIFRQRKKHSWKGSSPAMMNGSWYPLQEQHPNGYTKSPKIAVLDKDSDIDCKTNTDSVK